MPDLLQFVIAETMVAPIPREQKAKVLTKTGKELQGSAGCPHLPPSPHARLTHAQVHMGLWPCRPRTIPADAHTHLKASAGPLPHSPFPLLPHEEAQTLP